MNRAGGGHLGLVWLNYANGASQLAGMHSKRYHKLVGSLDQAEKQGCLPTLLEAIELALERMRKFRNNPYSKIPDVTARRCESGRRHAGFVYAVYAARTGRSEQLYAIG